MNPGDFRHRIQWLPEMVDGYGKTVYLSDVENEVIAGPSLAVTDFPLYGMMAFTANTESSTIDAILFNSGRSDEVRLDLKVLPVSIDLSQIKGLQIEYQTYLGSFNWSTQHHGTISRANTEHIAIDFSASAGGFSDGFGSSDESLTCTARSTSQAENGKVFMLGDKRYRVEGDPQPFTRYYQQGYLTFQARRDFVND